MGAFLGFFLGCCVIAWSVFFVGRRIARVLWGLLIVAEHDEEQRAVYLAQRDALFGESERPKRTDKASVLERVSNTLYGAYRPPWA